MLSSKLSQAPIGVRPWADTIRMKFKNGVYTSTTNLLTIGGVYAIDHLRATSTSTDAMKAWGTIVPLDATNGAYGVLVVAEEAAAANATLRGVISGPTKAKCYGTLVSGDPLKPDTSNAYFVKATVKTDQVAWYEGAGQTATNANNLADIVLCNNK